MKKTTHNYQSAQSRWARFGAYYAIFPWEFAHSTVNDYSSPGEWVLDPFAGRGSVLYAAKILGRHSFGIEINPIGWLYSAVKLTPASKNYVLQRLLQIYAIRQDFYDYSRSMPEFYHFCYCSSTLCFLIAARCHLDWKNNEIDATLMAFILVYLHGKREQSLSNQMQITRAMGMQYSIDWWQKKEMLTPPTIDPYTFLYQRITWRYEKGIANSLEETKNTILLGDSSEILKNVTQQKKFLNQFSLLFTSPPCYKVTDYHADQWLRLWMLGYSELPQSTDFGKNQGRFNNKKDYIDLLDTVFGNCALLMKTKSTVVLRTNKRKETYTITKAILEKHFPDHSFRIYEQPLTPETKTQAKLYLSLIHI
jgi:hypothetical protein